MQRILAEIEKAKEELKKNPEDDGLTELGIAATEDSMCYVDAESARMVLDWIERVVREEDAAVATQDRFSGTKQKLTAALQGVKDSLKEA
jgi:hypothetical protein